MSTRTAPELAFSRAPAKPMVFHSSRQGAFAPHRDLDRIHAKISAIDSATVKITPKTDAPKTEAKPFGLFGAVSAMRAHTNDRSK